MGNQQVQKMKKKLKPCLLRPSIVAPKTIVKLNENVKTKWLVDAKLYGTRPTKLLNKINTNSTYINGKYIWPFFSFICPTTILCTVAYIDSWDIDQALGISLLLFVLNTLIIISI